MPDAATNVEEMFARGRLVQQTYMNGFQIGITNADVGLVGLVDNQPVIKLNMSYTVAKTLLVKLGEMMDNFEKATGREIMTTDVAGVGLEEVSKQ